jgi:hypothetical protein
MVHTLAGAALWETRSSEGTELLGASVTTLAQRQLKRILSSLAALSLRMQLVAAYGWSILEASGRQLRRPYSGGCNALECFDLPP